jgi:uncharacterized membrane protein YGL010W
MKPLAEQLAFYRSYHRTPGCKATHFFGVPLVTFSLLIPMGWLAIHPGGFRITAAMAFVVGTLAYYFRLDPVLAILMALIMAPVTWGADLVARLPMPVSAGAFAATLALGIAFQAVGHVIERKRPALADNFFQAVFTAPLFLLIEAMEAMGWERHKPRAG